MNLHKALQRRMARFGRDAQGTSAIEFAFIAPMLVIVVLALSDVSALSYGSSNMQSAVRSGIHYAMAGGTDAATAQTIANNAWSKKPGDGVVTSARVCKCAGAVVGDCDALCADTSRPEMYITVTATGTVGGDLYSMTQTSSETVRVR
jgi:Flp pilus assembly protein TadG